MVVLGYPDTTLVTMEEMEHHVRAAARAKPRALLGADLPFHSYDTAEQAVASARRLVQAGAEFVKAEGGLAILTKCAPSSPQESPSSGTSECCRSACARKAVIT